MPLGLRRRKDDEVAYHSWEQPAISGAALPASAAIGIGGPAAAGGIAPAHSIQHTPRRQIR